MSIIPAEADTSHSNTKGALAMELDGDALSLPQLNPLTIAFLILTFFMLIWIIVLLRYFYLKKKNDFPILEMKSSEFTSEAPTDLYSGTVKESHGVSFPHLPLMDEKIQDFVVQPMVEEKNMDFIENNDLGWRLTPSFSQSDIGSGLGLGLGVVVEDTSPIFSFPLEYGETKAAENSAIDTSPTSVKYQGENATNATSMNATSATTVNLNVNTYNSDNSFAANTNSVNTPIDVDVPVRSTSFVRKHTFSAFTPYNPDGTLQLNEDDLKTRAGPFRSLQPPATDKAEAEAKSAADADAIAKAVSKAVTEAVAIAVAESEAKVLAKALELAQAQQKVKEEEFLLVSKEVPAIPIELPPIPVVASEPEPVQKAEIEQKRVSVAESRALPSIPSPSPVKTTPDRRSWKFDTDRLSYVTDPKNEVTQERSPQEEEEEREVKEEKHKSPNVDLVLRMIADKMAELRKKQQDSPHSQSLRVDTRRRPSLRSPETRRAITPSRTRRPSAPALHRDPSFSRDDRERRPSASPAYGERQDSKGPRRRPSIDPVSRRRPSVDNNNPRRRPSIDNNAPSGRRRPSIEPSPTTLFSRMDFFSRNAKASKAAAPVQSPASPPLRKSPTVEDLQRMIERQEEDARRARE